MDDQSIIHNTFVIERAYPNPPSRVFAAFADSAAKRRWFAEGETNEIEEFTMDFRVGGVERHRYRFKEGTLFPGAVISNEGMYQDIIPGRRVILASTMSFGDRRVSVSLITIDILPGDNGGSVLICTNQGVYGEGSGGPQIREAGWQHLLGTLATELAR